MAKIKFGKEGHLELEITPNTIWANPGSDGEFMEYQLSLRVEGKEIFNSELKSLLTIVKGEEDPYLADFISDALSKGTGVNWTPLEPKATLYMQPVDQLMCCGANEAKAPFVLEIALEQNIFAGEGRVFGNYSNTGVTIHFEASADEWRKFAQELYKEEDDFDEESESAQEKTGEESLSAALEDEEIEINRRIR